MGIPHACTALWCCGESMCEYVTLISSYENIRPRTGNIWNNWPKELLTVILMRDLYKPSLKGEPEPLCFTLYPTKRCRILCKSPEKFFFIWNVAWNWPHAGCSCLPACLKLPECRCFHTSALHGTIKQLTPNQVCFIKMQIRPCYFCLCIRMTGKRSKLLWKRVHCCARMAGVSVLKSASLSAPHCDQIAAFCEHFLRQRK